ncbi:hypothetical protein R38712_02102 [Ralstonia pickettii]|jgi:hypothetical protein|uniref:Uncharacterized protein n=1 Tax=Ralstonia pickettii TaxID=329 RepID=A0ABN9HYR6_RALPI|nr:hypothetical protein R38712_02102 [Ralstonia pickettii]
MRASNRCLPKTLLPPIEIEPLDPPIGYELSYFPVCIMAIEGRNVACG